MDCTIILDPNREHKDFDAHNTKVDYGAMILKLSNVEPDQYLDGRSLGHVVNENLVQNRFGMC